MNKVKLTEDQNKAFNLMKDNKNIFLTGNAGCGKSYLIKLYKSIYQNSKTIALTSTTGTSAILIGGTTLHSYLGIGLGKGSVDEIALMILNKKYIKKRWLELDTLIIDEISMLSPELFDKVEEVARIVRCSNEKFGGIQLILTGDLLQLPCVESDKLVTEALSWEKCIDEIIYLKEIIRQKDKIFQTCLNEIRLGEISEETKKILLNRVNVELTNEFSIKPTKLFSVNYKVDEINNQELDKLASNENTLFYEYEMKYTFHEPLPKPIRELSLDRLKKNCIATEILQLCVGTQVMLLKNIDIESGMANGSRGIITKFIDEKPLVKFLSGVERIIDYDFWNLEEGKKVILSAKQIPLKVAFAISIHKSQGSTLDYCEMDLSDVFEYGQAYTALSRVKDINGLSLSNIDFDRIKANPKAKEFYDQLEKKCIS